MQHTRLVERKNADFTVTALDSGKVYILAAADIVVTLPATESGLNYKFIVEVPSAGTGASISPAAADSINGGADDKDVINTGATDKAGDACEVWGDGGAGWAAILTGTWAAEA